MTEYWEVWRREMEEMIDRAIVAPIVQEALDKERLQAKPDIDDRHRVLEPDLIVKGAEVVWQRDPTTHVPIFSQSLWGEW